MNAFIDIIKWASIIQVLLILILVFSIYFYKAYVTYYNKLQAQFILQTEHLLNNHINKNTEISPIELKQLRRFIPALLTVLKRLNVMHQKQIWQKIKDNLLNTLLLPKARKYARKRNWYKRYFATQVFQLAFHAEDAPIIKHLITDTVPLVALNAAKIAVMTTSEPLIKQVITSFSINRRLQNAIFIQAIEFNDQALSLIAKHLNHEQTTYARVFCYQILNNHPNIHLHEKQMIQDMNSKNIDLQIAALTAYVLTHQNLSSFFIEKLQNEHWEIRAQIAKLMGQTGDISLCPILEQTLSDKNWWVRMNTAESLYNLGSEGRKILKRQKPEKDRFAYEAAQKILTKTSSVEKS